MKTVTMRRFYLTILAVLTVWAASAQAQTRYLASMPDIPLMAQMAEIKDSRVVFDKAEGRIVEETVKAANLSPADVLKFYNATLPALGWTGLGTSGSLARFSRNGEQLIVNLEKLQAEGLVSFAVSPKRP